MSRYDYERSKHLMAGDPSFTSLVMAAMRKADTFNLEKLRDAFPEIHTELVQRYNAPGGLLPHENRPNAASLPQYPGENMDTLYE